MPLGGKIVPAYSVTPGAVPTSSTLVDRGSGPVAPSEGEVLTNAADGTAFVRCTDGEPRDVAATTVLAGGTLVGRRRKLNLIQGLNVALSFVDVPASDRVDVTIAASGGGGGGTAATTTFAPAGGIAATDVQAAIQELDSEKAPKASPTFTGTANFDASGIRLPDDSNNFFATIGFASLDNTSSFKLALSGVGSILSMREGVNEFGPSKFTNAGLSVYDSAGDHLLNIRPVEDLTAHRVLMLDIGDANRTITLDGNLAVFTGGASVGGTNNGDQVTIGTANQIVVANGGANPELSLSPTLILPGTVQIQQSGLLLRDTDNTHNLAVNCGSNLTAGRTLTLSPGDADRTIMLGGNLTVSSTATVSGTNSGDQTISLTGDATGSGTGAITLTLANNRVTFAKMADLATDKLIGRASAGTGDPEAIDCTAFARSLLDDADSNAALTTLGGAAPTGGNGVVRQNGPTFTGTVTFDKSGLRIYDDADEGFLVTLGLAAAVNNCDLKFSLSGTSHLLAMSQGTNVFGVGYFNDAGLNTKDTDGSHYLSLRCGSNLSAARSLVFATGDATRILTLNGDATLAGSNTGDLPDPLVVAWDWSDFSGAAGPFATASSGTGSSIAFNTTGIAANGRIGFCRLTMGTAAGSYAYVGGGSADRIQLGSYAHTFYAGVKTVTLSDATDTFWNVVGLFDTPTGASPVDGCYLRYKHDNNSGKWEAVCISNSAATTADTGITVAAGTWYDVRIEVNASGTSVAFYIDNSLVATITTNIPTGSSRVTSHYCQIIRTAGTTTARQFDVDYQGVLVATNR